MKTVKHEKVEATNTNREREREREREIKEKENSKKHHHHQQKIHETRMTTIQSKALYIDPYKWHGKNMRKIQNSETSKTGKGMNGMICFLEARKTKV